MPCKDLKTVSEADFFFSGLNKMGNTSNVFGSKVTPVTVTHIPGLDTLGISMARIDYAPFGLNLLHTHPRGTEILYVSEGKLQVGFITSNPDNTFISNRKATCLYSLLASSISSGTSATHTQPLIVMLSNQNAGVISIPNSVFGSKPDISSDVLAKAFRIPDPVLDQIKSQFAWTETKNHSVCASPF